MAWLAACFDAGGTSAVTLGILIWQRQRLSGTVTHKAPKGTLPGMFKLTISRVQEWVPMNDRTISRAIKALKDAELIYAVRPGPRAAYQIRVRPLKGEEQWTYTRLAMGTPDQLEFDFE
jgi:DNA-binding transcriptional ArsR family regulator